MKMLADDYRLLKKFDPSKAKLTTWLTVIARNACIDAMRRKSWDLAAMPEHEPRQDQGVAAKFGSGESARNEDSSALKFPPGLLSERQTLILRLTYEKKLKTEQIAAFLKIEAQSVRSARHKAIDKLRKHGAIRSKTENDE